MALGYRLRKEDSSPSPLLAQRIAQAARLATTARASLIFSGGVPPQNPTISEAGIMRAFEMRCLRTFPRMVLLENRSRSTRENAIETTALLRATRPRRPKILTVVTNGVHAPRACRTFAAAARAAEENEPGRPRRRGAPRLRVQCAAMPPSTASACSMSAASESDAAWCAERCARGDPREAIYLALRELPALALYWWRGWLV